MSLTTSNMLPLGTVAPDFNLPDVNAHHQLKNLSQLKSKTVTVIMFICNHCPYVKHIKQGIINMAQDYAYQGVNFIAICANDIESYPDDAPELMAQEGYLFPYLYDETQMTARAYQAACTPDMYVFDAQLKCVYRGRFDAATPGNNEPVTGADLRQAIDAVLGQAAPVENQRPSMGCNIKWKNA